MVPNRVTPDNFCVAYHQLHGGPSGDVYDPAGPLLDDDGMWHLWEDLGGWSHWKSRDLIHWSGSFTANTTNFSTLTGAVSPTPTGMYAFYPDKDWGVAEVIDSAVSTGGPPFEHWVHRRKTIPKPARIDYGFRDPARAFEWGDKWWLGVGCGRKQAGGQICLFESLDATLQNFTDRGSLFTVNETFGSFDGNVSWSPRISPVHMFECPDVFPLGDKWVVLGAMWQPTVSLNQWWVGSLSGDPPAFTPERVGLLDYGNYYGAKSGSGMVQTREGRRVVFGFTGWVEPSMPPGCGKALLLPRQLSLDGAELLIEPVAEVEHLRRSEGRTAAVLPAVPASNPGIALASGSQVEVRLNCSGLEGIGNGTIAVRTLATADGGAFTEIGYDLSRQAFYVDHTRCCSQPNAAVQRAPLPLSRLGGALSMVVLVDGGVVEAFSTGLAITALVSPGEGTPPSARVTTVLKSATEATCDVQSWQLAL